MSRLSIALVWHASGNPHYHDRFVELSRLTELVVLGPSRFQGVDFDSTSPSFELKLFKAFLSFHWLTYVSPGILRYLARSRHEILYLHEEPHSLMAFLCALFNGKRKLVVESSLINLRGNCLRWNLLEQFVLKRAACLIPKNMEVRDVLIARGAVPSKITKPVGNGVSARSFYPIPQQKARQALVEKFPQTRSVLAQGNFVIGYAGRIWRPKGIEVFSRLGAENGVHTLLCGPIKDKGLADRLRRDGVCILPFLEIEDLRHFYSSLDLFILPSMDTSHWREQFGRVCAEAIFCGTPAIGSNIGGIPSVVGASYTFDSDHIEQILDLANMFKDPRRRTAALLEQKERVESHFSWDSIAHQVVRICENA